MTLSTEQRRIIAVVLELATEYGQGDGEIATVREHLIDDLGEDCWDNIYALQRTIGMTLDRKDVLEIIELSDEQEAEVFVRELDGMVESTEEFIRDDGLRADDQRVHDLSALLHTRELWESTFKPGAGS